MHLRCEDLDSPVWRLWLAPAEGGHPVVTPGLVAALADVLLQAGADERCRAVVIAGEGAEFCRGMDLAGLAGGVHGADGYAIAIDGFARCLGLLRTIRPATVCVVDGTTSGGGVGLAAACDLVIAGRSASFALPELLLGLIPAVILPVLAERIGPARARWLALSGATLDPAGAERWGLVDELADDPAVALATRLKYLLRASPAAVGRLKRFGDEIAGQPRAAALAAGAARTAADLQDPAVQAAIAGFIAGEMPPWAVRYRPGAQS